MQLFHYLYIETKTEKPQEKPFDYVTTDKERVIGCFVHTQVHTFRNQKMLGRIFIDVYNEIEASVRINNTSCAS